MNDDLQFRLDGLMERLRTAYDGIGHSSGRPYVYFVYPPTEERRLRRLVQDTLRSDAVRHGQGNREAWGPPWRRHCWPPASWPRGGCR